MRRLLEISLMGVFAVMVAGVTTKGPFAQNAARSTSASAPQYEVLNPWADVDPKPVRGINPRLTSLEGKTIGLFANYKRAAVPMLNAFDKRLKEKFPTVKTSLYHSTLPNVTEAERDKAKFEAWLKGVDAVVAAVGD